MNLDVKPSTQEKLDMQEKLDSQEILDAIDLGKISLTDKKKRGRPKKSQQLINPSITKTSINNAIFEQDEIILHLPISSSDIEISKNKPVEKKMLDSKQFSGSENESDSEEDKTKDKIQNLWIDDNIKQYKFAVKKLTEENERLKKFLIDITPMYFTEVKTYPTELKIFDMKDNVVIPKKTNICCWWCTYNFDCLPSFIPDKYHNGKFYVFGCFCSFNCAGAYNLNLADNKVWERYSLMKQMYYIINKNDISSVYDIEINVAGPKELLEKYGGPMTIEEYRKNSKILGREYHKLMPPFLPINIGFEESTSTKTNSKTININSILNPNVKDNIVVKRNKPLSNVASKEIDGFYE
jgi:hypothetical protein